MGWKPLKNMAPSKGGFLLFGEYADVILFQKVVMILFLDERKYYFVRR